MSKYKIKVIAHQLKNQVIAKHGDLVDETQLLGNASELAELGFVELVNETKSETETENASELAELPKEVKDKKSKKDTVKE